MKPEVNKKLKFKLIDLGLKQRDLARLACVSEWNVSLIARGRLVPTPAEQQRIAEALGCKPTDIFQQ